MAAAPATPVREPREAFALATKHAGCVALLPLLKAVWTQWSHILPFMDAADDDLDAAKIRSTGVSTQAVLATLSSSRRTIRQKMTARCCTPLATRARRRCLPWLAP